MRTSRLFCISLVATGAVLAACSSAPPDTLIVVGTPPGSPVGSAGGGFVPGADGGGPGSPGSDGGVTPSPDGGGGGGSSGLPCDVATYLAANCTSCHSDPPLPSALAGLVTIADLKATAKEDPTMNEAQLSVVRMQKASSPMPPSGLPSAADVAILENWIKAGYPTGSCGGDGGSPVDAGPPPVSVFVNAPPFSSQTGPDTHNAGQNCMGCHNGNGDANRFTFGGTLYDGNSNPVAGAEVRLVDKNGHATSVYTGPQGTFYLGGSGFAAPAHVGARNASHTRDMLSALQASNGGACSACHCTGPGCTVSPIHLP